ncbi:hypothetical protein [Kribbella deserti]|uniref:Uncharacterized protein n=1 Tax=Kribbella deserti TaxID=1926257 RepID=A0ABV6QEG5_9ACTN
MARYDVVVRVRTGWPVSASGLAHVRRVGRQLPGRCRLRGILVFTEGFVELTFRMQSPGPQEAIQQARLLLPRFDLPRHTLRRVEIRRPHPLPSHRALLAIWHPRPTPTTPGPPTGTRAAA